MNNPDEETSVAQFGKGDKYFGICTLLVTMPGLPMFGHGQIEGFEEKYGMEYRRSYRDEQPDGYLVDRHEREIFPLMKRRALFSGSSEFRIYDLFSEGGSVNENVFAYTNRAWINGNEERAMIFYNNSYYETAGWIKVSDPAIPQGNGKKRRDSLHTALALHNDGSYFTLFREQRSNLWYIRSSKAIHEDGFFVALGRYETQVFIDIYEVQDDARGRWARLHHDLQGRPVSDPHSAIKDIYLGDLYYRFTKLLKEENVNKLHGFFTGKKGPTASEVSAFTESLKETAEKYFATVTHFIAGADGKFDPWKPEGVDVKKEFKAVNNKQLWDEFTGYVERLISLSAYLNSAGKTPAEQLLKKFAKRLRESKVVCVAALGYGLFAILRSIIGKGAGGSLAANLAFEHWDLDRKLKEQYRIFGASDDEVWRLGEISRAVLRRTTLRRTADYTGAFNAGLFASTIIGKNYLYDDFRLLLGLNRFNDVTWFNKEAFESALFYGTLFYVLEDDVAFMSGEAAGKGKTLPWLERVGRIAQIAETLEKAQVASGYQLDSLILSLTAGKIFKGKTAKPETVKTKTPSAKPEASTAKPKASSAKAKTTKPKTPAPKPKAAKPETPSPKPKATKPKTPSLKKETPKKETPKVKTATSKPSSAKSKAAKPKATSPKQKAATPKTSASKSKTAKPKASSPKAKPGKGKGKGKG